MVRVVKVSSFFDSEDNALLDLVEIACLSTDDKPTAGIATGSILTEVDTGKVYFYNEAAATWVLQFSLKA